MSSSIGMCEGGVSGPRTEIWGGSSAEAPSTRGRGRSDSSFLPSATWSLPDRAPNMDKENVDPSGPSNRRCHSSVPSWHPRYPLQDITLLMHFLQDMQLDADSSVATPSGGATVLEVRKKRSALPVVSRGYNSNNNAKSSTSLRMNFR